MRHLNFIRQRGLYECNEAKRTHVAEAKGRIEIINGHPWITVTDFRRLKIPNCNCFLGDENREVIVDTVAFPNEGCYLKCRE